MGAINGEEYIKRIDEIKTEIWYDGKKISGKISEHPNFKGLLQTKAELYDIQHSPSLKDIMTFSSPLTGDQVGMSYLMPKTKEDLVKRRKMIEQWAKHSGGTLGRSPDYLNTVLTGLASSAAWLKGRENCFPEHLEAYYERAREQDLSFTHTFISPQVNRSSMHFEENDEPIAARIVEENDDGIVIKGARLLATQGGLTDELIVFNVGRFFFNKNEAFAFAIPSDSKGLKFICRNTFVGGDSKFEHPLSSRYEEMDSIVVFDNVLVPWERVFYYKNPEVAEEYITKSAFHPFAKHQVIVRQIVKTEFILGLAGLIIETINIGEFEHIQSKMSEIIIALETMKALLEKAENHAALDEWGYMRPDIATLKVAGTFFPKIYPRLCEIIQLLGASGLITLPTENAFSSDIRKDLDLYLQGATKTAEERVKIFSLAWDLTMSSFGTRQTQYERYFFGDPVRLKSDLYRSYPKDEYAQEIRNFLDL